MPGNPPRPDPRTIARNDRPSDPTGPSAAAGAAQLRAAIDRGQSADKIAHPDPAAAPLGTDAEAAGTPPTAAELRLALSDARRASPAVPPSAPLGGAAAGTGRSSTPPASPVAHSAGLGAPLRVWGMAGAAVMLVLLLIVLALAA